LGDSGDCAIRLAIGSIEGLAIAEIANGVSVDSWTRDKPNPQSSFPQSSSINGPIANQMAQSPIVNRQ
jgi:hypothetical protein